MPHLGEQRECHARGLRRLAGRELEAGVADAETRGQRGLRGEPRAMLVAAGESEVGAGHARGVGRARRREKQKLEHARRGASFATRQLFYGNAGRACLIRDTPRKK